MKNLKDLKEEIMDNKFQPLYIFYGEDYGIRHHYIQEISKRNKLKVELIYDIKDFLKTRSYGKSLFKVKHLYVCYCTTSNPILDFESETISKLVKQLEDNILILVFDKQIDNKENDKIIKSNLWNNADRYITYFQLANDNICSQFIDGEVNLNINTKKELIFNCERNYNKILMETDKIKRYAEVMNISHQEAYEVLENKNQLLISYPKFHSDKFMNDVLQGHKQYFWYWYNVIKTNFLEDFWIAEANMMNDLIIAYMIKKHGSYQGGGKVYELGFNWGRIKTIREFHIPYTEEQLLKKIHLLSKTDRLVKTFKLSRDIALLDYFFCFII